MKKITYAIIFLILIVTSCAACSGRQQTSQPAAPIPSKTMTNPVDKAEMQYVPAGDFIAGGSDGSPGKTVHINGFYIYKFEVTNRQFRQFIDETGYKPKGNWSKWTGPGTDNHPVIMVAWVDAQAYCRWAGVRLPTEAQWERAARGTDGRLYPWGNRWDPSLCNNRDTPRKLLQGKVRFLFEKSGVVPVGSFPRDRSPAGVMDMAGNAAEWTGDWFGDEYPATLPGSPKSGTDKVLRGGSFYKSSESCRLYHRDDNEPGEADVDYTFRCVWLPGDPPPQKKKLPTHPLKIKPPEPLPAPGESPPLIPEKPPKKEETNKKDGAGMILIPAGSFVMGARKTDPDARPDELPRHQVSLSPYYIYKNEVTYRQFKKFVDETGYTARGPWKKHYRQELLNHPVVYVTWEDARAYCRWAGGDLPTEAQWERAARGTDGRIYPWGNRWNRNAANVLELSDPKLKAKRYIYYDNLGTTPVGAFPLDRSPEGLTDVAGNVIEWCRDWYDPQYYTKSPLVNPAGPKSGTQRVMRGGGWGQDQRICRLTYRDRERPGDVDGDFGFRCVVEINCPKKNASPGCSA